MKRFVSVLLTMVFLLFCGSCSREDIPGNNPPSEKTEKITLLFHLPGQPKVYGHLGIDENAIGELDLLAFSIDDSNPSDVKEHFLYHTPVLPSDIEDANETGSIKRCAVTVTIDRHNKQRLILVANARAALESITFTPEMSKEQLLQAICFTTDGDWKASSKTFTPFPMWGESQPMVISATTTTAENPVRMLRAVARIDIQVAESIQNKFKLKEVYLFNRYEKGRIIPDASVLEYEAGKVKKVNKATVPSDALPVEQPKANEHYASDNDITIEKTIYLLENSAQNDALKATCLVIGGEYNGNPISYYRIDFMAGEEESKTGKFRSLLRNHQYVVRLTAVNDNGKDTPDNAFRNKWVKIETDVQGWSLWDISWGDEGLYSLRTNPSLFRYNKYGTEEESKALTIYSDYFLSNAEQGWSAELLPKGAEEWLKIEGYPDVLKGDAEKTQTIRFQMPQYNGNTDFRHAYLKVKAGNLTKYIDFYQSNYVEVSGVTESPEYGMELTGWIESGHSSSIIDGPYRLGVGYTSFTIPNNVNSLELPVSTDYKNGYSARIENTDGNPLTWLTITENASSAKPADTLIKLSVDHNTTNAERIANIVIKAGDLERRIKVKQIIYIDGGTSIEMNWTVSEQSASGVDGPYRLGVNHAQYALPKNVQENIELILTTDYKKGYTATVTTGEDWITLKNNIQSASPVTNNVLTFNVMENNGNEERNGRIRIQAGNIKKYITITQSAAAAGQNEVNVPWQNGNGDNGMDKNTPVDGPYTLNTSCSGFTFTNETNAASLTVIAMGGGKWTATTTDSWITGITQSASDANGTSATLSFTAETNDTGKTRTGRVRLNIVNQGTKLSKDLIINQFSSGAVEIEDLLPVYQTQQTVRQYFTLKSRMAWRAEVASDPSGIIQVIHTTGGKANLPEGEKVYFVLKTIDTGGPYTAGINISSPTGAFTPYQVTINAEP